MDSDDAPDDMSEREHRDLAALADGSLSTERRREVEARVADSRQLQASLGRQRRVVDRLGGIDLHATPALRARIASAHGEASRKRRRFAVRLAIAAGAVGLIVAAIVALPFGADTPEIQEVSGLAYRSPDAPAPSADRSEPALLDTEFEGLAYPNWDTPDLGWRAVGERSDEINGRSTNTVFYEKDGRQIAYTIVSGEPIEAPADGRPATRDGVDLVSFRDDGRLAVTWLRDGRTCVLSGTEVDRATLLKLAAWKGDGAVVF